MKDADESTNSGRKDTLPKRSTVGDLRKLMYSGVTKKCEEGWDSCLPDKTLRSEEQNKFVQDVIEKNKSGTRNFLEYSGFQNDHLDLLTKEELIQVISDGFSKLGSGATTSDDMMKPTHFYLEKEDNRRLSSGDTMLVKEVVNAVQRLVESYKLDFDARAVQSCVKNVYFCSTILDKTQQICVYCVPDGSLAEKVMNLSKDKEEQGGVIVTLGKNNIRFKVRREQQSQHTKLSMRVKEVSLLKDDGLAISATIRLRLARDEPDVQYLQGGFVKQTNVFEVRLSGTAPPESFRANPFLECEGAVMPMAFSGEPLCEECEGRTHTTKQCPQARARRAEAACHECGEPGHTYAVCPKREPPKCFACKQPGHFKAVCPSITCLGCGKKGHMVRNCPKQVETKTSAKKKKSKQPKSSKAQKSKNGATMKDDGKAEGEERPTAKQAEQPPQQEEQKMQVEEKEGSAATKKTTTSESVKVVVTTRAASRKRQAEKGDRGVTGDVAVGPRQTPLKEREQDRKKNRHQEVAAMVLYSSDVDDSIQPAEHQNKTQLLEEEEPGGRTPPPPCSPSKNERMGRGGGAE